MKFKTFTVLLLLTTAFAFAQKSEETIKAEQATGNRSIDAATFVYDSMVDNGGDSYTLTFTSTNASTDAEWIYETAILFPATFSVTNVVATVVSGSNSAYTVSFLGNEAYITDADDNCGNGYQWSTTVFQYDITVTAVGGVAGAVIAWQLEGDGWGAEPHVVRSTTYPDIVTCVDSTGIVAADDIIIDAGGPGMSEVPTLGEYTLFAFISLFAIAGIFVIRRRS